MMSAVDRDTGRPPTIFLIAGEESGDQLGAGLMAELSRRLGGRVEFVGVGGDRMARHGLRSMFPMSEISLHGIVDVVRNVRNIMARMRWTAAKVTALRPDVLVIIDVPGFNLGVARRVRKRDPGIPIVEYVSPTVWVWRPGRARWMKPFVDRIMAILPFEPAVHRRLGGPLCTYVGHPLIERFDVLRPAPGERQPIGEAGRPVLLILPGSRSMEVNRLTDTFGQAVGELARLRGPFEMVLPAVPRFAEEIARRVETWPVRPAIVTGEAEKFAAFRRAHAALAASGTVTLELALSGVPMVVAYKVDRLAKLFKRLVLSRIHSIVLPNLVLDANAVPEFIDQDATPQSLARALLPLLADTPERAAQLDAFKRLDALMSPGERTPSAMAADIVLETMRPAAQRRLEIGS
jgi:lipid-A-disaccharide synthase